MAGSHAPPLPRTHARLWYVANPDWVAPYYHEVESVRASRAALLAAYHVAFPGLGTVSREGAGFRWHSVNAQDEVGRGE